MCYTGEYEKKANTTCDEDVLIF